MPIKKLNTRFLSLEMDQSVKRMLKLIEEDGDSFAKKAEMYYKKRPELVSLVEDFYRMYRSLAERYDHVTGELKKNVPSDLQSQSSCISDLGSELPSAVSSALPSACPSPEHKLSRPRSGHRAAGFDFFLGSNSIDYNLKEGDESSTLTDSEDESDDSSVNNYFSGGGDNVLQRRVIELEIQLREVKEKLRQQEEGTDGKNETVARYEEQLRLANEKIQLSGEELSKLKMELQKYSSGLSDGINDTEEEIARSKQKLEAAQKDVAAWKAKANSERKEVTKLQERITRLKTSLTDRDHEVRELKVAVSDAEEKIFPEKAQIKAEISGLLGGKKRLEEELKEWEQRSRLLEEEIRKTKAEKTEIEERFNREIEQLKTKIAARDDSIEELNGSLNALESERDRLNDEISKLKEDLISREDQIDEMEKHLHDLHMEHVQLNTCAEDARRLIQELRSRATELEEEIKKQKALVQEGAEEKREAIRQLCFSLEHYRNGYLRLREAMVGNRRVPVLAS